MPTSFAEVEAPLDLAAQTTDPGNTVLMQWGPIQFKVWPMNIHELDHLTETDWAKKEIAGAAIYREWVGENDEIIKIRGHLFPYRIGGVTEIEHFEAQRRGGIAHQLVRGGSTSGQIAGWYVCHSLSRQHTYLSGEGIGQMIAFEAEMVRVPVAADPPLYLNQTFTGTGIP